MLLLFYNIEIFILKNLLFICRFQTILSNKILCLCGRYYRWTCVQCFPGWFTFFFNRTSAICLPFFTPICLFLFQAAAVTGSGAKICDNEKSKIGHRRVNERGEITFKKVTTDHLMGSIQLGL